MNILLNISQISIITGDNPYKRKRDYIIELWEKVDKNDYERCKEKCNFLNYNDMEKIIKISDKNNINIKEELNKCNNAKDINELSKIKNLILKKIDIIPENEKKEIENSIKNVTNTNFGIKNENDITKLYENITSSKIIKDDKYIKKLIIKNDKFSIYIGGKIDGINIENNTIIEIKNRVNKLFYELRNYEKVQIICYMYIFSSNKGHLVEALKKKDKSEINIIEVDFDEIYMNNILIHIKKFVDYFYKFMNNEELKIRILNNPDEIIIS